MLKKGCTYGIVIFDEINTPGNILLRSPRLREEFPPIKRGVML
jgi:hypothetical protein